MSTLRIHPRLSLSGTRYEVVWKLVPGTAVLNTERRREQVHAVRSRQACALLPVRGSRQNRQLAVLASHRESQSCSTRRALTRLQTRRRSRRQRRQKRQRRKRGQRGRAREAREARVVRDVRAARDGSGRSGHRRTAWEREKATPTQADDRDATPRPPPDGKARGRSEHNSVERPLSVSC